jgi:hypothetical protein
VYDKPPVPQSLVRPIVRVQPSTRVVSTTSMDVSQMSVKELVLCLNQCALPQLCETGGNFDLSFV